MFLSMMKSMLNFLIVSLSKYNQAGRNILKLSSILFLSERSELRIMPNIYQKKTASEPMDQRMSLHHLHKRDLTLQIASRPILAPPKRNCHCFRILTAWCLAFPGITHQVTYIPFVITKHVLICMM